MIFTPGSAHSAHRAWPWWLGQGVLYLLLWASLFKLPSPPTVALDSSWQLVLSFAASHGLQHGQDITFTYGPLGYLLAASYMGDLFGHYLVWQVLGNLLLAAGLYRFGRTLPGWRQAVYYLYVFWIGSMYADAIQMMLIAIFGLMLTQPENRRPRWIIAIACVFAIFALIKFTNLMLGGFIVATLTAYYLAVRAPRHAALLLGVFVAVFLGGWLACGQAIGNIPAFLYYGMQLSFGYSGAMGYDETPVTLALGLTAAASVTAYAALYFFSSVDRLKAGCAVVILGALVFINWKHGFVRADAHIYAHFVTVLMVACTFPALMQDNPRAFLAKQLALGVGLVISLQAFYAQGAALAPSDWNDRVRKTFVTLLDLPHYHQLLDHTLETAAAAAVMPKISGFVGRETVDQLGDEQGFTLLNRLNYTPRPAVQGYTAYTAALNRFDEAFFRSERAPRFVIQRYRSIDGRLIALDDSLTQKLLYQNYDYVLEEAGLILWERPQKIQAADPAQEKIILRQTVYFGEVVTVPDAGDRPIWAVVRIAQNLPGKIRQLLYKPPTLTLDLEDDRGVKHEFRFVHAMGAAGFILQPFFSDSDELIAYQNGRPPRKVRRFSLRTMPGGESYYSAGIEIELRTIAPFKRAANGLLPDAPHRFRMMNRAPESLHAENPAVDAFVDGEHLLQMHPPSAMTFAVDQPVTSLRAAFGIMPGAYAGPDGTQGVEFIVEWQGPDGRTERLYSRLLDPRNRPEDRPRQTLQLALGARRGGKLLLRTEPGPSGNKAYCWSYWTEIEIR